MTFNFFLQSSVEVDLTVLWVTIAGFLVFFMHAGFTLLESGMTQSKNAVNIAMKNLMAISVGTIIYWFIGYSLMYGESDNGFFRWSGFFTQNGPPQAYDLFFQTMFAATCATIVSGAVAGRTKYSIFGIFAVLMTGLIYPIAGGWEWNPDGWLNTANFLPKDSMGETVEFIDLAGSSIVHAVGGWAALVGAYMVGPRLGKYVNGNVEAIPGHNKTLATLGVMALWFGWFGFNGGSQLALGSAADASAMSIVVVNTNIAACGGVVAAIILSQLLYKKIDLSIALNGAIAGLVAITAGPDLSNHFLSMIVGAIGGILCTIAIPMLDKMKIDDVVGAISAHLVAGIWGTLAVGIFGSGDFLVQLIGIVAAAVLVVPLSGVFFYILKGTVGLRVSEETEASGLDSAELTTVAYPEFK